VNNYTIVRSVSTEHPAIGELPQWKLRRNISKNTG